MGRFWRGFVLFAGLAFATPLSAQGQRPQEPDPDIIVEGTRDRERQVDRFLGALTDAPILGQISRFDFAVCPVTLGLPAAQNQAVADRLRSVARAAEIPVGTAGCRPNVFVIVTADKRALIEQLARRYPAYFTDMSNRQIRRLARQEGPATAWHVEGLLDPDGNEVPRDVLTGQRVIESSVGASRLSAATRPHFAAAAVVVQRSALTGLTTTQLADYAAMRTLPAPIRPGWNAPPRPPSSTSSKRRLTLTCRSRSLNGI